MMFLMRAVIFLLLLTASCVLSENKKTYICDSTDDLSGFTCTEVQLDACRPNLCENNGLCYENGDMYLCMCQHGWMGEYCQLENNTSGCQPNPCQNGAACISGSDGSFLCQCPQGWTGENCTDNVCDNLSCQNGGNCKVQQDGSALCICPQHYVGQYCEIVWSKAVGGEHCWAFVPLLQTFDEAQVTCQELGGQLANIGQHLSVVSTPERINEYQWIQDWLRLYYNAGIQGESPHTQMWLGGKYTDGTFRWLPTNEPIECENKAWRVPQTGCQTTNIGLCLVYVLSHIDYGTWQNYMCGAERPFLCLKTGAFSNDCMELNDVPVSYQDQNDLCQSNPCLNGGTCIQQDGEVQCLCDESWAGLICNIPITWFKSTQHNDVCYTFIDENVDFATAQARCENIHAELAVIESDEANVMLRDWLQRDYNAGIYRETPATQMWVGGQYDAEMQQFMWLTGAEVNCALQSWGPRGCTSHNVGQCLAFSLSHINYGKWLDYPCTYKRPYLCRLLASRCPGDSFDYCQNLPCKNSATCISQDTGGYTCECAEGWTGTNCDEPQPPDYTWYKDPNGNNCYSFVHENVDFETARSKCEAVSAQLADINSELENQMISDWLQDEYGAGIYGQTPQTQMWIGGKYNVRTAAFQWIYSGANIECALPWGPRGCASTSAGECLAFSLSHINYAKWFDYPCTYRRPFLCKVYSSGVCPGNEQV